METVDALLESVHVDAAEFRVDRLDPGPATIPTGTRWAMVALSAGGIGLPDVRLDPGDALLTRGREMVLGEVGDEGATVLVAQFALRGPADRLLRVPEDIVERADSEMCRLLVTRLTDQFDTAPTSDVVATRLLDWLVAATVRDALGRVASAAIDDGVVAAAVGVLHDDPAAGWTVDGLARRTGVSRATFAQRFRDAVGTSPMAYLRELRLDLAEQALLTEPDATVAAVARRVGYASPFAFSSAFRRHRGVAPARLRRV